MSGYQKPRSPTGLLDRRPDRRREVWAEGKAGWRYCRKEEEMRLTGGQVVARALKEYGVQYVAGVPGHGIWSLFDAFLEPGGFLLIEHGAQQADAVADLLVEHGWRGVSNSRDIAGHPRVTTATRS